ncbi:hypothetical protein OWR29_06605 [Actinoplanes sp. Pm04-4]|uniref:Uncharacterized protein n=1 Tax=Paractinoplanes pyxinae TaxID=2997416 RepID=A0ABT4ATU3_9ACTN|nr:hypothetical protein [Actinoplanes pyxinae]MCY1137664.1 hypothetical protein [Actinoplanes pyxinae]
MLTDRDRVLLAPHLALLRSAEKELAAARRSAEAAARGLTESAGGTDWRDRVLGGLFSADDGRTQQYRKAKDARKAAEKALAEAEAKYAKYAERVDGLVEPMLARDDPGFQAIVAAVRACDKAVRAGEEARRSLSGILKPDVEKSKVWHEAEFARRRQKELIDELRTRIPGLRRTIERAAQAVGETPPAIDDLPATERQLREWQLQLELAIREVTRWRAGADQARAAALRAAHGSL